jgi:HK97 family phage prohead protease
MNNILSYKTISNSVKDVDVKGRVVTGYLSNFDNEDLGREIVSKGAFTKTLNERRDSVFFLNQHDWKQPHGKFDVLIEDSKGLYFESKPLVKGVSYSDDALKLYEAGILTQHSFGYEVLKDEKSSTGARILKEIRLHEGSNVTLGMNPETPFTGFKSLTPKEVDEKIKKIINYIKNGNITDDGFILLEIALKELQSLSFELGQKALEKDNEPFNYTPIIEIEPLINTIKNYKF